MAHSTCGLLCLKSCPAAAHVVPVVCSLISHTVWLAFPGQIDSHLVPALRNTSAVVTDELAARDFEFAVAPWTAQGSDVICHDRDVGQVVFTEYFSLRNIRHLKQPNSMGWLTAPSCGHGPDQHWPYHPDACCESSGALPLRP